MTTLLDPLVDRLDGLLTGTYTASGRYVTGATFTKAKLVSSASHPEWTDVVRDRVYDVAVGGMRYDSPGDENVLSGPHATRIFATLRVQYALRREDALTAPVSNDLGALGNATERAASDAHRLRFIVGFTRSWADIAIACFAREVVITRPDPLRVLASLPIEWLVSTSATTSTDWAT